MSEESRMISRREPAGWQACAGRWGLALAVLLASVALAAVGAQEYPPPEERTLLVRGDYNFPPYEFLKDGEPAGYNIEMLRAVARVMDLDVEVKLGPWSKVRRDLEEGRADIISGMMHSAERDEKVDFSEPHIIVHHSLFVRRGSSVESLDDLDGRPLIVQEGDIMHDYALREDLTDKLITVETPLDALTLLHSGNYECALIGRLQGLYLARREGLDNVQATGPSLMPRKYCFAVREGDRALLARLNEGLRVLSATGEADKIYDRWFGPATATPHPWRHLLPWAVGAAALALIALLVVILWSRSLSHRVKAATARLEEELKERRAAEAELAEHRDHLEDIVEERTRELREANEAMIKQERLATLGHLTATVSHELRNPLGTIRNSAYTVREHMRRAGVRDAEAALDRLERALVRCDSIIQELLEYTRSHSLSPSATRLDRWVDSALDEMGPAPGVELERDLDSGAYVRIDRDRFRRVLTNLVDNAMQAITGARSGAPAEGPIDGRVIVRTRSSADKVELQVSDTGPGIDPEALDDVFEPLFTTKSYGVGLGLPIVRQIVRMHGGEVELQTEPGEGTTFTCRLPRAREPEG